MSPRMGTELNKAWSWEIDNLLERNDRITSEPFSSGGCDWSLIVFPKGYLCCDHLSLYLRAVHPETERPGWKRRVRFSMVLLNQSGKELYRSPELGKLYCANVTGWGFMDAFPLTKLQEKGVLEKNKLTIQVYINVLEVVHQGPSTENDMLECNGFMILVSQFSLMRKIFAQHPGFADDVIPKNQGVRTVYMNLLFGLIETLSKSPQSLSVTELSNAQSELDDLTEAGFNLDWLKSKLEEASLERKKALISDGSWVVQQELEERVKNVESLIVAQHRGFAKGFMPKSQGVRTAYLNLLLGLIETLSKSPQSLSATDLSNAQSELDDLTEAGLKLDWLKTKLEDVALERKNALIFDGSWVHQEGVKNAADSLIVTHPPDFMPQSQGVRAACTNLLLGLIETLSKSPQSLSETELSNAQSELDDLTEAGFKIDMLKSKLEEVSLERKKALISDGSWVMQQELEERVKNVESTLSDLKLELAKEKMKSAAAAAARVSSFELIEFFIKRFFLSCFSISKY